MSIRDLEAYTRSLWDWEIFDGVLPRGLHFGDLDGIAAFPGGFVIAIEGKRADEAAPPVFRHKAQELGFRFWTENGRTTVYVIGGDPGTGRIYWVRVYENGQASPWRRTSLEEVREEIRRKALEYDSWSA